ncbi:MAG: glycosyltransferase family 2 protein [Candidatus Zapsychrus exili]|nr:glycosyltransferase family 2 protein [Candidatus Zapsychrus exili]
MPVSEKKFKLSTVIPVYNDEDTIVELVNLVKNARVQDCVEKEIIVIDDGSDDGTKDKLKSFETGDTFRIIRKDKNEGKTSAVKIGIKEAAGDFILIQDADLEYSPEFYYDLLDPILNDAKEVVYGSRFMGNIKNMTIVNRTANRISNLTINLLFGSKITDFHTCFKMFKADVLKSVDIESRKFSFDTEVTAKLVRKGHFIHEIPISYVARKKGKKITWGQALEAYFVLIKCRFANYEAKK